MKCFTLQTTHPIHPPLIAFMEIYPPKTALFISIDGECKMGELCQFDELQLFILFMKSFWTPSLQYT